MKINVEPKPRDVKTRDELGDIVFLLKPLTYFEYSVGVFRFYARDGHLRPVPPALRVYGLLLLAALLANLAMHIYLGVPTLHADLPFDLVTYCVVLLTRVFIILQIPLRLLGVYGRRDAEVLRRLARVDRILGRPFQQQIHKGVSQLAFGLTVFAVIFVVLVYFDYTVFRVASTYKILSYVVQLKVHLAKIFFIVYVKLVMKRLSVICDVLHIVSRDGHPTATEAVENKAMVDKLHEISKRERSLRALARAFDGADSAAVAINGGADYDLVIAIAISFLNNVSIFVTLYILNRHLAIGEKLLAVVYITSDNLGTVLVCSYCQSLLRYKERIKHLLNRTIVNCHTSKTIRSQAKVFIDTINDKSLKMNAFNMFNLDMRTIVQLLALSTTYVIILIQTTRV